MKTATKERGIMFSGPMMRALLEDRKTQTRRIMEPDSPHPIHAVLPMDGMPGFFDVQHVDPRGGFFAYGLKCPYGQPGDRLWGREAWKYADWTEDGMPYIGYRADGGKRLVENVPDEWSERLTNIWADLSEPANYDIDNRAADRKWRPAMFMPRWASRLTLEITDVRVERVQEIGEMDALAEGIEELEQGPPMERFWAPDGDDGHHSAANAYAELWDSINGKTHPWASDPFVWAISFKRVEAIEAGRSE